MILLGTSTQNIATLALALGIFTIQTSFKKDSYWVDYGSISSESIGATISIFPYSNKTQRGQSPQRGSGLEPAPRFLS